MRLVTFRGHQAVSWGVLEGDAVADLGPVLAPKYPDLRAMLADWDEAALASGLSRAVRVPAASLEWLPVIPNPGKIICVGLNYEMHRKEMDAPEVERASVKYPTIFARYANSQVGHGANIVRPRVSSNLDFEGELAVIVGKAGRYITRDAALDHVAGYACYNDATLRDWQNHSSQFTPGKNFPGTGAFGPCLVTRDEVGAIGRQRIQTRINGERVQDATLGEMIFDIPKLIEYCSTFTELQPGDVIASGTPGGVGDKRTPPLWLKPGDVVEVEIDGVGLLSNKVSAEP